MLSSSNNMDIVHDRSSLALLEKGYKETMNILSLFIPCYICSAISITSVNHYKAQKMHIGFSGFLDKKTNQNRLVSGLFFSSLVVFFGKNRTETKMITPKENNEFLKLMKHSEYSVVEQLKKTLAKISMLSLI
jgi:intein-encoded DNA endonuclease-like protein